MAEKYRFKFSHPFNSQGEDFGPYSTEDEAKEAFQRIHGYWPEDAIGHTVWVSKGV